MHLTQFMNLFTLSKDDFLKCLYLRVLLYILHVFRLLHTTSVFNTLLIKLNTKAVKNIGLMQFKSQQYEQIFAFYTR